MNTEGPVAAAKLGLFTLPTFGRVRLCILLHMGARVDVSTCGCMESRDQPCLSSPGAVHLGLVLWFVGSVREALWLTWSSPHRLGWFFSKPWESSILYIPRAGIRALTTTLGGWTWLLMLLHSKHFANWVISLLSLNLHTWCGGLEDFFKKIIKIQDMTIPKGGKWAGVSKRTSLDSFFSLRFRGMETVLSEGFCSFSLKGSLRKVERFAFWCTLIWHNLQHLDCERSHRLLVFQLSSSHRINLCCHI